MVSATAPTLPSAQASVEGIASGLTGPERERLEHAFAFAQSVYEGKQLGTGEAPLEHALGLARSIADLRLDADARAAGLLFAVPSYLPQSDDKLKAAFGAHVASLVDGITQLNRLRVITRSVVTENKGAARQSQAEVLRKMLLAMVADIRVVLLRLASRAQTLRFLTRAPDQLRRPVAQETLDIYAPLANRLGVWQLKWELEDLSFRFLEPEVYKRIAGMLDERRGERERFIDGAIGLFARELSASGVKAQISGRPKHIYSIYSKMRQKSLDFEELYDVRGVRVLVDSVKDCYTVLGVVHNLWQPIPREFDDYISRPKGNFYRSLHTAVIGPEGRTLEVQIRTHEMHGHAELGVAAHWRYKEGGFAGRAAVGTAVGTTGGAASVRMAAFDERIEFLRQVLAWRDEIVDSSDWVEQFKQAALDDTVYVVTPQGRVIDLPQGATPIDFAYALHTDLGHHCRGAKVDGAIVPLDYRLKNGERIEIIAAKSGGPSRDWMNPALGYIRSARARNKVRQWFNSLELGRTIADGRAIVERELQREGQTGAALDQLAAKLGYAKTDEFFAAVGREDIGVRQIHVALRGEAESPAAPEVHAHRSKAAAGGGGILIVGVDRLLTQLARCCKAAPPDAIVGFVTRGRGVSIHRGDCSSLAQLKARLPERMISAQWGAQEGQVFPVDIVVRAGDRHGLLRDISEVLSREQLNVTAVNTQSKAGTATMLFTVEVDGIARLKRTLSLIEDVRGVFEAARR